MTASTAAELRSSSLGRARVRALIASWLGWMFDGYETYALPENVADGWDGYKQDPSRYYNNPFTEGYNDHILIAVRDLPAGTVLQVSDLTFDHGSTIYSDDVACLSQPSDVIGQKTLRPLAKGEILHASNIERLKTPYPCANVADGWDGYIQTAHH